MLKKYEYVGQHHTMVVLEKGQPKVRVEPNEEIETELTLPKGLFKLVDGGKEKKRSPKAKKVEKADTDE